MSFKSKTQLGTQRRKFLKISAIGSALLGCAGPQLAAGALTTLAATVSGGAQATQEVTDALAAAVDQPSYLDPMKSRRIHLVNAHTWESLDVVYYTHGIYIDENIDQLNHLMRDRRANISKSMDLHLYDQLLAIHNLIGSNEPVHVLSGYRTPETNAALRRRSSGVAKNSLHMKGRAADIYIPGVSVKKLQLAALSLKAGGVGIYSKSNFVHMDTGAIRHWGK